MTKDMTNGSPMKHILGFAVPMLFGLLFQQVYNLVDTMIVGKILGVQALAATGATGSVFFLIVGFCMGMCNGFAIPVARSFGAKDEKAVRRFAINAAYLGAAFAIVITITVVLLCRKILELMNTPADIIDLSYNYIVIIFAGIPATILYNLSAGMLYSLGDSRTPVICLVISAVLNIVLDLLFILTFKMGIAGAAIATVISTIVSGIACFMFIIFKCKILRPQKGDFRFRSKYALELCHMGIPMGLQYSITAIGTVILQYFINGLGSSAVASIAAGLKITMFFSCPFDALGSTMATYGGQNVGAQKFDRLAKGMKSALILAAIYSAFALIVMILFGSNLATLFLDANQVELCNQVKTFLIINTAFFMSLATVNIVRFLIQGMGFSSFAIIAGICEMVARVAIGIFAVPRIGYVGGCLGNPIAWVAADAFLIPAFFYCRRKVERKYMETGANQT